MLDKTKAKMLGMGMLCNGMLGKAMKDWGREDKLGYAVGGKRRGTRLE